MQNTAEDESLDSKYTVFINCVLVIKLSINDEIKLSINDGDIKQVKNTIFFGIIIDECLTWSEHIAQVVKKYQGLPVSLLKLDTF